MPSPLHLLKLENLIVVHPVEWFNQMITKVLARLGQWSCWDKWSTMDSIVKRLHVIVKAYLIRGCFSMDRWISHKFLSKTRSTAPYADESASSQCIKVNHFSLEALDLHERERKLIQAWQHLHMLVSVYLSKTPDFPLISTLSVLLGSSYESRCFKDKIHLFVQRQSILTGKNAQSTCVDKSTVATAPSQEGRGLNLTFGASSCTTHNYSANQAVATFSGYPPLNPWWRTGAYTIKWGRIHSGPRC